MIVSTFVEHPEEVEIRSLEGDQLTVLELSANRSDTGRIIGKNGRTVRALRDILLAMQAAQKRRYTLEIADRRGEAETSSGERNSLQKAG